MKDFKHKSTLIKFIVTMSAYSKKWLGMGRTRGVKEAIKSSS